MNLLRVVTQKHKDELMGSLKASKFQYSVGFKTFANPVSRRFGAITVDAMDDQRGTDLFLKNRTAPVAVDE